MKLVLLSLLLFTACSQINTESRDYYAEKKKAEMINNDRFRHGLVPIPYTSKPFKISKLELDKASVERGKNLYARHCISCHGPKADGNGVEAKKFYKKPKSLVKIIRKVPNFKLYMMVSQWKGEMPGWKSMLNEKETADIKNYLLNLAKK